VPAYGQDVGLDPTDEDRVRRLFGHDGRDRVSPLAGGWLSGRYRKGTDVEGPVSTAHRRTANR
jgi:hypothetical protein